MRTSLDDIRERASIAELYCSDCHQTIGFDEFLANHPNRINEEEGVIEFGCVSCGNKTVEMRRRGTTKPIFIATGLAELENLAGE